MMKALPLLERAGIEGRKGRRIHKKRLTFNGSHVSAQDARLKERWTLLYCDKQTSHSGGSLIMRHFRRITAYFRVKAIAILTLLV
ncbi:hypothetical protein D3C73_1393870 [compost metagenome]